MSILVESDDTGAQRGSSVIAEQAMSACNGWIRGAHAMGEMYATTDEKRFDLILSRLSWGTTGLALTEGARWLLGRQQSVQADQL